MQQNHAERPQAAPVALHVNGRAYRLELGEHEDKANPLGAKGLGELGIVGAAAAVANAVYNACGVRVRDLPITFDKLI